MSSRLKALRFPLIVGVVFIHAYATKVLLEGGRQVGTEQVGFAVSFVRNLISQGIARVAVPMFFLMSGNPSFRGTMARCVRIAASCKSVFERC